MASVDQRFWEPSSLLHDYFRSLQITESCLSGTPTLCSIFISSKRSTAGECLSCFLFSCCIIFTVAAFRHHLFTLCRKKKKEKKELIDSGQNLATHSCKGGWEFDDFLLFEKQSREKGSGQGMSKPTVSAPQSLLHLCPILSLLAKLNRQSLIQRGNQGDALGIFPKLVPLK